MKPSGSCPAPVRDLYPEEADDTGMEIKLHRTRAGFYFGHVYASARWHTVEVEYVATTAYGDRGWFAWIGPDNVTEHPRRTMAEAVAALKRNLQARTGRGEENS